MKLMTFTLTVVLIASFLLVGVTASEYDPWLVTNDDGEIDIFDIVNLAGRYGSTGIPINKTDLLIELQAKIDSLNTTVSELEARLAYLELLTIGLVGYWNLDEASGLIAYDSSGHSNDGIIYGASWAAGIIDSALSFNGVDSYVEIPDDDTLDCRTITIEAWVKVNGTTGDDQIIVTKWYPDYSYTLELNPDGATPQFVLNISQPIVIISDTTIPIGSWAHIAGTYEGSTAKIYINGTLAGTTDIPGGVAVGDSLLCFGSHSPAASGDRNWFKGIIDGVRIYNKALTTPEIEDHYAGIFP